MARNNYIDPASVDDLQEQLIKLNRTTKVVKGGRNFAFSAMMVVGNKKGIVGLGYGKAKEIPDAIKKATEQAKRKLVKINLQGGTIPHQTKGKFCASEIWMKPASAGTGIIAGGNIRAVLEYAGVQNILSKCYGSRNTINASKAALESLKSLKNNRQLAKSRGLDLSEVYN